jgi:hypothetical protein
MGWNVQFLFKVASSVNTDGRADSARLAVEAIVMLRGRPALRVSGSRKLLVRVAGEVRLDSRASWAIACEQIAWHEGIVSEIRFSPRCRQATIECGGISLVKAQSEGEVKELKESGRLRTARKTGLPARCRGFFPPY